MQNKLSRIFCIVVLFISTTTLRAQGSGWEVNPHDYQYDMTVYAQMSVDGNVVSDYSGYEIAAFVGDECRGIAEVETQSGYTWLYLRVRSNVATGEKVSFKIYDANASKVFGVVETMDFSSNGVIGMPSNPTTLTLKRYTLGDVNDDGKVNSSDVMLAIAAVLKRPLPEGAIYEAIDVNEDQRVNSTDVMYIINKVLKK